MTSEPLAVLQSLLSCLESGRPCALCAIVNTRGSTPRTGGAMMLVRATGETEGTIGGGYVEAEVRRRALDLLSVRSSALLSFDLDHNDGWSDGPICGGRMDLAVVPLTEVGQTEPFREAAARISRQEHACLPLRVRREEVTLEYRLYFEATPTLLIAGAGHVGMAIAKLAVGLDFRVVVVDDRGDLLCPQRFPPPIETASGKIEEVLRQWRLDENTYVVIVTRGHVHDERALQTVIDSPARYLGMIGSRHKVQAVFDHLESLGVARTKLQRVHAPIGIEIGSVTVPEIALSIAAELTQVRRTEALQKVDGPFPIAAVP
jgi:xanthine dehydrogenase accessory factor